MAEQQGVYNFWHDAQLVATWKESDPTPAVTERYCMVEADVPRAKIEGEVKYYSAGYCRLEYIKPKP